MFGRAMLRWPASARLLLAPHSNAVPTSTLVLSLRAYAIPGRPKTVVGEPSRPVKRAGKRAAASPADGTSAAEKEIVVSKHKAASERERVELTDEQKATSDAAKAREAKQKAVAEARAGKDRIDQLKKAALDPPRQQTASAYLVYMSEQIKSMGPVKDENGVRVLGLRMKEVAAQWKALGPAEIEHYNHIARVKVETYMADYKRFVESFTPDEIRKANNARKQLNKILPAKPGKSPKYSEIKDERVVTKPRNCFLHFATNRLASGDFKNISVRDRMKLISAEWKELSAEEKSKYEELAKKDRARYIEDYKDTYGHDVPMHTPKAKSVEATA